MKKIGTITFHASYNYGSCLQAYALQEFVKEVCNNNCIYKIINLRTPIQKEIYKNYWEKTGIKNYLKKILFYNEKKDLLKKEILFENFINNKLDITKEYNSSEELKRETFNFEYFISGSDQLWNLKAIDFDWSNYLEFVKTGKKIAYAASFGDSKQEWTTSEKQRIFKDLINYDYLSVREQKSFDNVYNLTKITPKINVDPTMLLNRKKWNQIISKKRLIQEKYIFFYNLKGNKEIVKIAKKVGKIMKLPVVISRAPNKYELFGFKKKIDVGPLEFLNLVKNAELVLSSSFHGTVFSIIFQTPFFAINGDKDYRIITLLKKMGLEERTINYDNVIAKAKETFLIDFSNTEKIIEEEKNKSVLYLKNALNIDE